MVCNYAVAGPAVVSHGRQSSLVLSAPHRTKWKSKVSSAPTCGSVGGFFVASAAAGALALVAMTSVPDAGVLTGAAAGADDTAAAVLLAAGVPNSDSSGVLLGADATALLLAATPPKLKAATPDDNARCLWRNVGTWPIVSHCMDWSALGPC